MDHYSKARPKSKLLKAYRIGTTSKSGSAIAKLKKNWYRTTFNAGVENDMIDNRHQNTCVPYTVQ